MTGDDVDESTLIITHLEDIDNDTKVQVEKSSDEDQIRFDTAGTERMIITDAGKVGIGTSSPGYRLDVDGDIRIRGDDIRDSSGSKTISFDGSANVIVPNELEIGAQAAVTGSIYVRNTTTSNSQTSAATIYLANQPSPPSGTQGLASKIRLMFVNDIDSRFSSGWNIGGVSSGGGGQEFTITSTNLGSQYDFSNFNSVNGSGGGSEIIVVATNSNGSTVFSSLTIRVMGGWNTIPNNSTLSFQLDSDGTGGNESFEITFKDVTQSGTDSGGFSTGSNLSYGDTNYINFDHSGNTTFVEGQNGFGIRGYQGSMQVKDLGGNWTTITGISSSPAGSANEIQLNDGAGNFSASSDLQFSSNQLSVVGDILTDDASTQGTVLIEGDGKITITKARDVSYGEPQIQFKRSRGTETSGTSTQLDDDLGSIGWMGYSGSGGFRTAASIQAEADETHGDDTTDTPARLLFKTAADGSSTLTERMVIKSNGQVGIGTVEPNELLTVEGIVSIKEGSAPGSNDSGYGKLYVDSSDSALKFQGSNGHVHNLLSTDGVWQDDGSYIYPVDTQHGVVIGHTSTVDGPELTLVRDVDVGINTTIGQMHQLIWNKDSTGDCGIGFYTNDTIASNASSPGAAIVHSDEGSYSYGSLEFRTKNTITDEGSCNTRMIIRPGGQVGIGYNDNTKASPVYNTGLTNVGSLSIHSHSTANLNYGPELNFSRNASMSSGTNLGEIHFHGSSDNSNYYNQASILSEVAGQWSETSRPTKIRFQVTTTNNTAKSDAMMILGKSTGFYAVGVGTTNPTARLHVNQAESGQYGLKVEGTFDNNTPIAAFENDRDDADTEGISIRIGPNSASDNSSLTSYIHFRTKNGNDVGRIRGNGSGGITVDNNFTGTHPVAIPIGEYEAGLIIETTGDMWVKNTKTLSSCYPQVKISTSNNSKAVFGVLAQQSWVGEKNPWATTIAWNPLPENHQFAISNSLGEGCIFVTNINGEIGNGDFINSSAVPGHGQKQDDDILRNSTVAKCIEHIDWDNISDTIDHNGITYKRYLASCTYHCG